MKMALQLNTLAEGERFKEFYGANNRQMPLLLAEGRTLLSAAGLMSRYLEVLELYRNAPEELKPAYESLVEVWEDNYFDLGDGAARHSDGRMKVVPDAPYLRLLTPETRLVNGAVDLSDVYAALVGEEFSKANVEKYCGVALTRSDAKENPIWLALARGDKALLDAFVDACFSQAKKRFRYDGDMMGVYEPRVPKEGAAGRLWAVCGLSGGIYGSRANGLSHLDYGGEGQLVGEAPEAQRATAGQLERILRQNTAALRE